MGISNCPECNLGKLTSLARKCHNFSLDDPIGMILISKSNRFIEGQEYMNDV